MGDWKLAHGWDGTVTSIGTVLNTPPKNPPMGGIFACNQLNWQGHCAYAVQPLDTCIQLNSAWNNQISSFGPDEGAICFGYSEDKCSDAGSVWSFQNPGDGTGGQGTNNPWDDSISSFKCEATGRGPSRRSGFTGDATLYRPDGRTSACGAPLQNGASIVALPEAHFEGGAHCGQHLNVEYNGRTIDATVGDLCRTCLVDGIELSEGAFSAIEKLNVGRVTVNWSFK